MLIPFLWEILMPAPARLGFAIKAPLNLADEFPGSEELDRLAQRITAGSLIAENGCIHWTKAKRSRHEGYGAIKFQGRVWRVHRLTLAIRLGRWPVGVVCHLCDNDQCINADHLAEGSSSRNNSDSWSRGHRQPGQPLTSEECQLIDFYHGQGFDSWAISEELSLPRSTVYDYLQRRPAHAIH
jgi:hypothetical protein